MGAVATLDMDMYLADVRLDEVDLCRIFGLDEVELERAIADGRLPDPGVRGVAPLSLYVWITEGWTRRLVVQRPYEVHVMVDRLLAFYPQMEMLAAALGMGPVAR